jgi:hypothetical protein
LPEGDFIQVVTTPKEVGKDIGEVWEDWQ